MSCGKPHDTDCGEVLAEVWMFLDDECDPERRASLQRHLDECGPCLEEYGLDKHLKTLLGRKCGGDHAPDGLRQRLRESIREIVVQQADASVQAARVTVKAGDGEAVVEVRSPSGANPQ